MPTDQTSTVAELRAAALAFRDARDWAPFHTPKDLALALGIEAGELGERFLWRTEAQIAAFGPAEREGIGEEMADVLIYLLYLSDALGIDLSAACADKLQKNERKYPVEKARGSAAKWTEHQRGDGA